MHRLVNSCTMNTRTADGGNWHAAAAAAGAADRRCRSGDHPGGPIIRYQLAQPVPGSQDPLSSALALALAAPRQCVRGDAASAVMECEDGLMCGNWWVGRHVESQIDARWCTHHFCIGGCACGAAWFRYRPQTLMRTPASASATASAAKLVAK